MIPFPEMHVAQSVLNRVMNTLEGNQSLAMPMEPPVVPDPSVMGQQIDTAAATPPQPAELPPEAVDAGNAGMLEASVLGGSPFNGALLGGQNNGV